MARRYGRRRSYRRRGTVRSFRRRPSRMTFGRIIKGFVIFAPPIAKALSDGGSAGGLTTQAGWIRGVLPSLTSSYSGINTNDGKFYPQNLLWGWGGPAVVKLGSVLGLWKLLRF